MSHWLIYCLPEETREQILVSIEFNSTFRNSNWNMRNWVGLILPYKPLLSTLTVLLRCPPQPGQPHTFPRNQQKGRGKEDESGWKWHFILCFSQLVTQGSFTVWVELFSWRFQCFVRFVCVKVGCHKNRVSLTICGRLFYSARAHRGYAWVRILLKFCVCILLWILLHLFNQFMRCTKIHQYGY